MQAMALPLRRRRRWSSARATRRQRCAGQVGRRSAATLSFHRWRHFILESWLR